jgi:mycoredoxin
MTRTFTPDHADSAYLRLRQLWIHPTAMQVLLYSGHWCPDCREAKRFLTLHKIPYTEIDIETTPGAAQEIIARTGKRAIPQLVIDGEWVQPYRPGRGFLYDEMKARFGIGAQAND